MKIIISMKNEDDNLLYIPKEHISERNVIIAYPSPSLGVYGSGVLFDMLTLVVFVLSFDDCSQL